VKDHFPVALALEMHTLCAKMKGRGMGMGCTVKPKTITVVAIKLCVSFQQYLARYYTLRKVSAITTAIRLSLCGGCSHITVSMFLGLPASVKSHYLETAFHSTIENPTHNVANVSYHIYVCNPFRSFS